MNIYHPGVQLRSATFNPSPAKHWPRASGSNLTSQESGPRRKGRFSQFFIYIRKSTLDDSDSRLAHPPIIQIDSHDAVAPALAARQDGAGTDAGGDNVRRRSCVPGRHSKDYQQLLTPHWFRVFIILVAS